MRAQICRILQLLEAGGGSSGGGRGHLPPPDELDPGDQYVNSTPPPRKTSRISIFSGTSNMSLAGSLFGGGGGMDDMEEDGGGGNEDELDGFTLSQLAGRRRSNLGRIVEGRRQAALLLLLFSATPVWFKKAVYIQDHKFSTKNYNLEPNLCKLHLVFRFFKSIRTWKFKI